MRKESGHAPPGGSIWPPLGGSVWVTLPGSAWATPGGSACPTPVAHYGATADKARGRLLLASVPAASSTCHCPSTCCRAFPCDRQKPLRLPGEGGSPFRVIWSVTRAPARPHAPLPRATAHRSVGSRSPATFSEAIGDGARESSLRPGAGLRQMMRPVNLQSRPGGAVCYTEPRDSPTRLAASPAPSIPTCKEHAPLHAGFRALRRQASGASRPWPRPRLGGRTTRPSSLISDPPASTEAFGSVADMKGQEPLRSRVA